MDSKQILEKHGYKVKELDQWVYPYWITHENGKGGRFWTLEQAVLILIQSPDKDKPVVDLLTKALKDGYEEK